MSKAKPVIMHVIHALSTGGLENGLVNIINRMPAEDFDQHIVCLTRADDFAARLTNPSVSVHELHKREGHDFRLYWRFWRLLGQLRPDIIHTRNFGTLEMQLLGLRRWRAGRVHGEHGRDMFDLDGRHKGYNRFRRFMGRFVHRYIAVSQDLQRWLSDTVGIPRSKVTQIYNGVDQSRFRPVDDKERAGFPPAFARPGVLLVGTVGRLAAVKSQDTLIRAFAALCEQRSRQPEQLGLIVVGDGPQREMLEALSRELGVADRCWFAGDRSDVGALLCQLDVFVLPSLNEGISNTILEAMACGLPVIATRVGGNPELVEDGRSGYLIDVGDGTALTRRLAELLDDRESRLEMGRVARQKIEDRFNWGNTVREYTAVYEALIEVQRQASTGRGPADAR